MANICCFFTVAESSWINSDVATLKDNETFCKCKKLTNGKLQCRKAKAQTLVKWRKGICVCSKKGRDWR
ncbi:hypothetical protein chiPu_0022222, partial [Chiloscyllium punctatum]|nr:hypothetical protein [Chiloscyllium punctatum]